MNAVITDACHKCGARLLPSDRFCSGCGSQVGPTKPAAPLVDPLLERLRTVTLGLYDVHSELGRGGMAAVYLAQDLRLQRRVAIKVMLPALFMSAGMADRFLLEARTAASLSHPNIVVIFSVSSIDDLFYFVMGLVAGAPLDDIVAVDNPLPVDEVRWILSQAARALQHAHNEGVVHRDVKPANIMINVRGDAILTDFGIAKASESPHLTRTGSAVGTPAYMSPEQVMASDITGASDQYSLGIVAYELLAGRTPFRGSAIEVQFAHVHNTPVDLAVAAPHVPAELASTVMRMLAKNPGDRWESLESLIDVFATGLSASGGRARQTLATRAQVAQTKRTAGHAPTPQSPLPALSKSFTPMAKPGGAPKPPVVADRSDASPPTPAAAVTPAVAEPNTPADISAATPIVEVSEPEVVEELEPQTLEIGQTLSLELDEAQMQEGVRFTSSNASCVAVDDHGNVRAVAPGTASVSVVIADEETVIHFVVPAPPRRATMLVITPATLDVEQGDTVTLSVRAHDEDPLFEYPLPKDVTWHTDNDAIATCSGSGVLTAHTRGRTTVHATSNSLSGTCAVTVTPALVTRITAEPRTISLIVRGTEQIVATAFDRRGKSIADAKLQYISANSATARVDGTGMVEALSPGRATIRIRGGDIEVSVEATVATAPVAEVRLPMPAISIEVDESLQLKGTAHDADGVELVGRGMTWRSDDANVIRISATGLATAVKPGHTTVEASCGAVRAQLRVTVTAVPIRDLAVTPRDIATVVGRTVKLKVQATDLRGRPAASDDVSWTSQNSGVCTVVDGALKARGVGATEIMARLGVVTTSVRVTVAAPVPRAIEIRTPPSALRVGVDAPLVAEVRDAEGMVIEGIPVRWSSDAPHIATVDANGNAHPTGAGNFRVTATAGSLTSSATVEVVAARAFPFRIVVVGVAAAAVVAIAAMFYAKKGATPSGANDSTTSPSASPGVPPATPGTTGTGGSANGTSNGSSTAASTATGADPKLSFGAGTPPSGTSATPPKPSAGTGVNAGTNVAGSGSKPLPNQPPKTQAGTTAGASTNPPATTTPPVVPQPVVPAAPNFTRITFYSAGAPAPSGSITVQIGDFTTLRAVATTETGQDSILPMLTSSRPEVARVEGGARVYGLSAGTTEVTARIGSVSLSKTVVVPAPPPPKVEVPVRSDAPATLSRRDFEAMIDAWVGAVNPQELATRITGGNTSDLSNRLHKLSAAKFKSEGGLSTRLTNQDGNTGQVSVSFPSLSSGGIPGTATATLDIKSNGKTVTSATLIGDVRFKNK